MLGLLWKICGRSAIARVTLLGGTYILQGIVTTSVVVSLLQVRRDGALFLEAVVRVMKFSLLRGCDGGWSLPTG